MEKDPFLQKIIAEPLSEDDGTNKMSVRLSYEGLYDKTVLPDISYPHFQTFMFTEGASDTEYFKYLRTHNMVELADFSSEGIKDLYLVVEDGSRHRRMVFKAVYDSAREEK